MSAELEKLREPFDQSVIKTYKVGGKDVPFAGARAYMDRLDEVLGPDRWSTTYEVLDQTRCAVECKLAVQVDGGWVIKSDVGYPNSARDADDAEKEPLKAAYSDAFKRAAVQWGVGRFLYDYAPGKPEPKPVADTAKTKQDIKQMGSFVTTDGKFNAEGWAEVYAPNKQAIANLTGGDIKRWLAANPSKSLDDLLEMAKKEPAVA